MRRIHLTGKRGVGLAAQVDDEDYEYLSQFTWNLDINGYPRRSYRVGIRSDNKVKCIQMQKEVAFRAGLTGTPFIDHIDRDKLNNKRSNLRDATRSINGFNRITNIGISGYRGVKPMGKRWQARIGGAKQRITIGTFDTPEQAAIAYKNYIQEQGLVVPV